MATTTLESELDALTQTSPPLIKYTKHPTLPLKIYNYTDRAQFKKHWNMHTLMARGLVLETQSSLIVARPMPKFFNYNENHHSIPKLDSSFSVLEKLDGSLGIWFCYYGQWMMATRGSFMSDQAKEGMRMAQGLRLERKCDPKKTYCFEIIYPENRILVDYVKRREIVLIAVIDTVTGYDEPNAVLLGIAKKLSVPAAKAFEVGDSTVEDLSKMNRLNEEGFVVRFNETGERVKVKFESYLELAKGGGRGKARDVSVQIRERLLRNQEDTVENYIDSIPDEFYEEVKAAQADFFEMFEKAKMEFERNVVKYATAPYKEIPDTMSGKNALCKWLRLARNGEKWEEVKDKLRAEYATITVRQRLRMEGKIKKPARRRKP